MVSQLRVLTTSDWISWIQPTSTTAAATTWCRFVGVNVEGSFVSMSLNVAPFQPLPFRIPMRWLDHFRLHLKLMFVGMKQQIPNKCTNFVLKVGLQPVAWNVLSILNAYEKPPHTHSRTPRDDIELFARSFVRFYIVVWTWTFRFILEHIKIIKTTTDCGLCHSFFSHFVFLSSATMTQTFQTELRLFNLQQQQQQQHNS